MATPFIGEVKMVSFNFPPKGWAFCNGQLLSIAQNQALFAILGTTYGGNGQTTFALPNLQGSVPMHFGNGFTQGQVGGSANVTLNLNQAGHAHSVKATATATTNTAAGNFPAASASNIYGSASDTTMNAGIINPQGGSQPHTNFQPYLCVDFIISLFGIFPSPT